MGDYSLNRKTYNFLSFGGLCVGFLFLALVFVWNLLYRVELVMDGGESLIFNKHYFVFYIAVFLYVACLILIRPLLARIKPSLLFGIFCVGFLGAALYIILNTTAFLRGDPGEVFNAALALNEGDITSLLPGKYGYLKMYFRQIPLAYIMRLMFKISTLPSFLYLSQVPMIFVINFCLWKITATLWGKDRITENLVILLTFSFLPQLFFVMFFYKDIIAVCLLSMALYCLVRAVCGEVKNLLFEGLFVVFASLAVLIHNALLIAVAALCIVLLLLFIKDKKPRHIVSLVALVILSATLQPAVIKCCEKEFSVDLGEEMPSALILMGISEYDDEPTSGGWFTPRYMRMYFDENVSDEELKAIISEQTKERIDYLLNNPGYALGFFRTKLISTWAEPTYESVWCGPLRDCAQVTETKLLASIYDGEGFYKIINGMCAVFSCSLFGLCLIYIGSVIFTRRNEADVYTLFVVILFIGAFLAFIVSETKSRYVYPVVLLFIPIAARQLGQIKYKQ